jgi:hypothetical protein
MKASLTILVLSSFIICESGYFMFYLCRQHELKQEMKNFIRNNKDIHGNHFSFNMEKGKVSDDEFEWEEYGKEFIYKGQLYDVIGMSIKNGRLQVHAINDKQEDHLKEEIAKTHPSKKKNPAQQLVSLIYIQQDQDWEIPKIQNTSLQFNDWQPAKPLIVFIGYQSPPPKVA